MEQPDTPAPEVTSVYAKTLADAKERRKKALALRQAGKVFREIGLELGVSTERARQMVEQAEKE